MTDRSNVDSEGIIDAMTLPPLVAETSCETPSVQRRKLAAIWLATGSAVAFMIGASWYDIVRAGGLPPGSDLVGHAAAAEWLRTLPWWDWRGWSDWFYGGQAIGVNYPPLGHIWMRFTHPVHGQMFAVVLGLLVLLPWGALRLARAVGYPPRLQRIAVGAVLVLAAASGTVFVFLSGFDARPTFFGSWPAMLAAVTGLFTAAWAARCCRPITAGAVAGVVLLLNSSLVPGWIVIWCVLLVTSGASFKQTIRWAVATGAAALTVSGWWLVPFLASWDRVVSWDVSLNWWFNSNSWHRVVLIVSGLAAAWTARKPGPARRLSGAAVVGLSATLLVDYFAWMRPERWLGPALLMAAISCAALAPSHRIIVRIWAAPRPVWKFHIILGLVVIVDFTGWIEILPLVLGLFLLPVRSWAWVGCLAWSFTLFWGGLWGVVDDAPPLSTSSPLGIVAADSYTKGTVHFNSLILSHSNTPHLCTWNHPWETTKLTDGRIRPLSGVYRETSSVLEFISLKFLTGSGFYETGYPNKLHWLEAWQEAGTPQLGESAGAEAMGARWYAECDKDGNFSVVDLIGVTASGVTVALHSSEDSWHRATAQWWIPISAGLNAEPRSWEPVPIRSTTSVQSRPTNQAATGVWMRADGDRITVGADTAGWVWLRVPWDPYWQAPPGAAVRKGGPGHLVVWVPEGETELEWRVPARVDAAAVAVTGAAGLTMLVMAVGNRRRGDGLDPDRPRPVRAAVDLYADTVDGWLRTASRQARRKLNAKTAYTQMHSGQNSAGDAINQP